MRHRLTLLAAVAAITVGCSSGATAPKGTLFPGTGAASLRLGAYTDAAGRTLRPVAATETRSNDQRLWDVTFTTPYVVPNAKPDATHATVPTPKARILFPKGYFDAGNTRRYPVLYLLHGGGDSYTSWSEGTVSGKKYLGDIEGDVAGSAADSGLIVVMPEGSQDGFYSDWYEASHNGGISPFWESFDIGQLIPWTDANLRTDPKARAIAGDSMGGFGAIGYTERHPGLFDATAGFSPALDNEDDGSGPFPRLTLGLVVSVQITTENHQGDPSNIWGPTWNEAAKRGTGPGWAAHNPIKGIGRLGGADLSVYIGVKDTEAPRGTAAHCVQNVAGLAGQLESALCYGAGVFDDAVRASTVKPAYYRFEEHAGEVHDFVTWNADVKRWAPHLMEVLGRAG